MLELRGAEGLKVKALQSLKAECGRVLIPRELPRQRRRGPLTQQQSRGGLGRYGSTLSREARYTRGVEATLGHSKSRELPQLAACSLQLALRRPGKRTGH